MKKLFQNIILQHSALFPHWELDDLYKLVYQAAMGSEHAAADERTAFDRIKSEADALLPNPGHILSMPICPDNRLVRIGVGPYLRAGGDLRCLAKAFVQTAQSFKPSQDRLVRYWSWVEAMTGTGDLPMGLSELEKYMARRRSQGYPAVHHSDQYRRLYQPAYRVILKELLVLPSS